MSDYSNLKAAIDANIKQNGSQEITGPVLNSVLKAMVDSLGAGYQYAGVATPETTPGTPDYNVVYLASEAGTYTNFGGIVVADGEVALLTYDGTWSKQETGVASADALAQLAAGLRVPFLLYDLLYRQAATTLSVMASLVNGESYKMVFEKGEMSDTDIDNLRYFRVLVTDRIASAVFMHTFDADERDLLKGGGKVAVIYEAATDTSYVSMAFLSSYAVDATIGYKIYRTEPIANLLENIDTSPQPDSENLVTSGGVYAAINPLEDAGSASFTQEARFASNLLLLEAGNQYRIVFSASGLSETDINNLYILRIAKTEVYTSYVFSYSFTALDKATLQSGGEVAIGYTSAEDSNYIHLYFTSGYVPTSGNTISVRAYVRVSVATLAAQAAPNPLKGKTLVCIGDSITEFAGHGEGILPLRYSDYIRDLLGMEVINIGIGGTDLRQRASPVIAEPGVYHGSDYGALDMVNIVRSACGMMYDGVTSYLELARLAAIQIRDYKDTHDDNTAQVELLASIDWSKVDYVTIFGGTNDWHGGTRSIWGEAGSTDPSTTLGAVNEIVRVLLTTYPHIKLYWLTPIVRWMDYDGSEESKVPANFSDFYTYDGVTLKQLAKEIEDEARANHIPVCDLYNELGWNMYNFAEYFGDNQTHPFRGFEYLGGRIAKFLLSC